MADMCVRCAAARAMFESGGIQTLKIALFLGAGLGLLLIPYGQAAKETGRVMGKERAFASNRTMASRLCGLPCVAVRFMSAAIYQL